MKFQPMKERPGWCPKEGHCTYVYSVGQMCIGCLTPIDNLHPWKNAYSLCFGEGTQTCIRTKDLLAMFKLIKEAVAYERRNDPVPKD